MCMTVSMYVLVHKYILYKYVKTNKNIVDKLNSGPVLFYYT